MNLVFEDDLSGAILQRLVTQVRPDCAVGLCYRAGGKGNIKRKLSGFNNAAKGMLYLVLVDLDEEYECPPTLLEDWFKQEKHPNLYFRIAVREVESWLLASRSAIANYFGIAQVRIPLYTDEIQRPKELLLSLARKSRKKVIRDDLVPQMGTTAKVGPNYNARLAGFVNQLWDYEEALGFSSSLKRMVECLKSIKEN